MIASRDLVALALHARADPGAVRRGVDVARRGKVVRTALSADGCALEGRVRSSHGETYEQVVTIRHGPGGRLDLRGVCSYPVGVDCKHVVAACLTAAERIVAGGEAAMPPRAVAEPRVADWLRRIATAEAQDAGEGEAYPPTVRDRLLYVVAPSEAGRVEMEPWKARLTRDDRIGGRPVRYDPGNVERGQRAKFVRPSDETICRDLVRLRHAHGTRGIEAATLERAVATGQARFLEADGLALAPGAPRRGRFVWTPAEGGAQQLTAEDCEGRALRALALAPPWYVDPETGEAGLFETEQPPALAAALAAAPLVPAEATAEVAAAFAAPGGAVLPAPREVGMRRERGVAPVPVLALRAARTEGCRAGDLHGYGFGGPVDLIVPVLDPAFAYGEAPPVPPVRDASEGAPPVRHMEAGELVLIERDAGEETRLLHRLASRAGALGLVAARRAPATARRVGAPDHALLPDAIREDGAWRLEVAPQAEIDAAALAVAGDLAPVLRAEGWRVEEDEGWAWRLHEGPLDWAADAEGSGTDWFALSLTVEAGGETLDMLPLILSVIDLLPMEEDGELPVGFDLGAFLRDLVLHPRLADGTRLRLEGARLEEIVRAFLEVQGLTGFHPGEAPRLRRLAEALEGCGVSWRGDGRLLDLARRLDALAAAPETAPPPAMRAELCPYQRTGFGWLKALGETGFGGALADDMGLGKTVQVLALLAHRHLEAGSDRPSLLVAPTSMVGTWAREAAHFVPELRVLVLHGPDRRARFDRIADHHLVVTTYPLLHRDGAALFARAYDLAILDEAQAVKNPASQAAKRIREVEARQRLALTGTPVENNLGELWALFDWLVPGLLGDRRRFAAQIRNPIEREGSAAARRLLASRLRPSLLRRTKEAVAADLPPRTVIEETVPLGAGQAALYETLRVAMDARVRDAIRRKGVEGSRITILDALLKLRQACCDPALVKLDAARGITGSAKRARLMEMLEALMVEGRRVLVFSQFTRMLRLIEADVTARGWEHALLTGRTRDRAGAIARFQDGTVPLFLISLKAGGTGLTLTRADTVILYDPWWNPAVERQAMDRAHRIGQSRPVFVHRLIAAGTVEEAIQSMQARKQALADALFEDGASERLDLDEADLAALFAPVG